MTDHAKVEVDHLWYKWGEAMKVVMSAGALQGIAWEDHMKIPRRRGAFICSSGGGLRRGESGLKVWYFLCIG